MVSKEKIKLKPRVKKNSIFVDENVGTGANDFIPIQSNILEPTSILVEEEIILINNKRSMIQKIKRFITKKNFIILLFVILAVGFTYYFLQYRKLTQDPNVVAKEKTAAVIKQISALAVVPTDPGAVLATVSDITKLKDQTFFNDAQNGDDIVIFPAAMRAVLYRPSINKIINIGPLSSTPGAQLGVPTSAPKTTTTKLVPKPVIKSPTATTTKAK